MSQPIDPDKLKQIARNKAKAIRRGKKKDTSSTPQQVKGLGVGALLHSFDQKIQDNPEAAVKELSSTALEIPIHQITTNPFQPRQDFDNEGLEELSFSIRTYGLIQPITVRRMEGGEGYQLISGERRLRASKLAGLTEIPAYIRIANDQQMLAMALIENIQRQDLNPIEIAISYSRLKDELELTDDTLSGQVGKKRSTITNYLRLLKLPDEVQIGLKKGLITMGHARALAGIEDKIFQILLFQKAMEGNLSVRGIESLITMYRQLPYSMQSKIQSGNISMEYIEALAKAKNEIDDVLFLGVLEQRITKEKLPLFEVEKLINEKLQEAERKKETKPAPPKLPAEYQSVQDKLMKHFDSNVKIVVSNENQGKGRIVIPFDSVDNFNDIFEKLLD